MFDIKRSYGCDGCFRKFDTDEELARINQSLWRRVDGEPMLVTQPRLFCKDCVRLRGLQDVPS